MSAPVEVRFMGLQNEFVAFVQLPGEAEVRVRYAHEYKGVRFKCDACGAHPTEPCTHATAALRASEIIEERDNPPCD